MAPYSQHSAPPLAVDLRLEVDKLKSRLEVSASAMSELQALCDSKDVELSKLSSQVEKGRKGGDATVKTGDDRNDEDSQSMQDVDFAAEIEPSSLLPQEKKDERAIEELAAKVTALETQVEDLKMERDTATAALSTMKESSRSLRQEYEDSKAESEEIVGQWTGRSWRSLE